MVSSTLTTSGEHKCYNTKNTECRSREVMWVVDLSILRDPSQLFDRGDECVRLRSCGFHASRNDDAMCGGLVK